MNIKRTQRLLQYSMLGKVPALLVGHSGVGKSAVVEQTGKKIIPGHKLIKLMLSQCDIGDLVGLPHLVELDLKTGVGKDKDGKKVKVTEWARPEWMPYEPTLLFLDEINQANRDVESAAFQLVYEKRIHNHFLHPDSAIVAAVNPSTSEYTTANVMSSALVKRFVVIPFEPLPEEVIEYGKESNAFHESLLKYMDHQKENIGVTKKLETGIPIEPTPRTWEMASKLFRAAEIIDPKTTSDIEIVTDILRTTVGQEAAAGYIKFMESQDKPLTFEDVYSNWSENKDRLKQFRKDGREDLVSSTVNNVYEGMISLVDELKDKLVFTGYVNDIDNEDKALKKQREIEVKDNFDKKIDEKKFQNVVKFLKDLPKDLFYQFTLNYMVHKVLINEGSVQENLNRANAHHFIMEYFFGDVDKRHENLFPRIKAEGNDIDAFVKANSQ